MKQEQNTQTEVPKTNAVWRLDEIDEKFYRIIDGELWEALADHWTRWPTEGWPRRKKKTPDVRARHAAVKKRLMEMP